MALKTKIKPELKAINRHIYRASGKLIQVSFHLGGADTGSTVYKADSRKIGAYIFPVSNHHTVELMDNQNNNIGEGK